MKFLIDTNIVIPMEPKTPVDLEVSTPLALEFHKLAANSGSGIYVHPHIRYDLARDKDRDRAEIRGIALARFNTLPAPPQLPPRVVEVCGAAEAGSNDWVDDHLLGALASDAVDYLVTEDIDIHRKSKRLGLANRVLYLGSAVSMLRALFDVSPPPPPAVREVYVYQLDASDPIFDSLRADYPGFDDWLAGCKRKQRKAYVVESPVRTGKIAGLCITKPESELPDGRKGKALKLCTFKVSPEESGNRYGELLLKTVSDYLVENGYTHTYFTVLPKYQELIDFADDFGFQALGVMTQLGEMVMAKDLMVSDTDKGTLKPFDLHIKYGPRFTSFSGNSTFVVPILPQFHRILFPEYETQGLLLPDTRSCGNSIRKAYLSSSRIHAVNRGDNIVFYRSKDRQALTVLGIVESVLRSASADDIARHVGKQTVYPYAQIAQMCADCEVLAMNFRLVRVFKEPLGFKLLKDNRVLNGAPQSITRIDTEGVEWLRHQIGM